MGRVVLFLPRSPPSGGRRGAAFVLLGRLCVAVFCLYVLAEACTAQVLSVSSPTSSESPPGAGEDGLNGVWDGDEFYCFRGFRKCKTGSTQCIKVEQECDGVQDCDDGSDEGSHCESFDCEWTNRYMCPSRKMCMNLPMQYAYRRYAHNDPYTAYLCDGVKDCTDGSDEDESFCASYDCIRDVPHKLLRDPMHDFEKPTSRRLRCPGGKGGCVYEFHLCDANVDCVTDGGSDESDEFCKKHGCSSDPLVTLFQCRRGKCIHGERMCDGRVDCPDGDDEGEFCETISCPFGRVKCEGGDNRTCVEESRVCDGVKDCPGGTDEDECATKPCKWGTKCPSGTQCASFILCDGVKECNDGSDEDPALCRRFNCTGDRVVKCKDGLQCIYPAQVCDGRPDCADLSDENPADCRRQNCTESYVRCPGEKSVWCIYSSYLCAGYFDAECYLDAQDDPTFCRSKRALDILAQQDKIMCSNSSKSVSGHYCDAIEDCADGSDESDEFCKRYECPKDRVKCYGKWCVIGGLCDGNWDCPDGSDEKNC
ncbi:hypothetical protein CBR_g42056 [Chara braunii]|uniref:SRCR domain-containing protein n=1 Tax=Chara braunii TaxID=69332 RepID=A0A388LWX7_CHABU|nr:hypothetical protein CBR_g42056 [Chara braunii]|eukprot:GBG86771.1 hypothetical protein CBR_g42056 [Chara braunii]